KPEPLTTLAGDELVPSLSPDGKDVAFVWNGPAQDNWDVYVKVDGVEDPLQITSAAETDFSPDWSSDGRRLAFGRHLRPGEIKIVVKPYPDGPEQKIAKARPCFMFADRFDKILDWHPDGGTPNRRGR